MTMYTLQMCCHCHSMNHVGGRSWPFCYDCGHRADRPRLACDCTRCRRLAQVDLGALAAGPDESGVDLNRDEGEPVG